MSTVSIRTSAFLTGMIRMLTISAIFCSPLFADSLKGKVIDPQGRIVKGATLHLFDRRSGQWRAASSDAEGVYVFEGLTAGDYLIEGGVASNALSASMEISVRGEQSEDLRLNITPTRTDVLVTAVAGPQRREEAGKAIDVIDADTIALRDELSIVETIRTLPGIRVKQLEGPGSLVSIKTRGLRNQDTAVLIDGMRFRDAASPEGDATAFLESMLIVDTERIEVLRGPSSALYGSNALAGVINVSSRPGGDRFHGDFRTEGGGLGLIRSVLSIGGGVASDRLTYSGTVAHLNVTKGARDGAPYRNTSPQGTVRYSFKPGLSATARVWYANDYLSSTENPRVTSATAANFPATGPVKAIALSIAELEKFEKGQAFTPGNATYIPSQIDPDGRRPGSFLSTSGTLEHQVSPMTSYRVAYQRVKTKRTYLDGPAGPGQFEPFSTSRDTFDGYTDVVQARLDQRAGLYNFLTVGYEFEREKYFSFSGMDSAADSITLRQRSGALFVQDQVRLMNGQLQLTAAGRVQFFDLREPLFTGSTTPYTGVTSIEPPTAYTGDASIAYLFRQSNTKFRAHVGNSFRAPSGFERYGGGFGSYYGDPRLAAERAVAVDGGLDQWFFASKLQLSGTAFYTNLQETITFLNSLPSSDPFSRFFGYGNGGGGIARGFELSGSLSPTSQTKVSAAYTYTNSDRRTPTIFGTDYHKALGVSPHSFSLTLSQWIGRRISVAYDMSIVSDYTMTISGGGGRQFVFDGPHKADVVVSYNRPVGESKTMEIYVKVDNVFNQRAFEDGYVGPKAWAIGGLRLGF
jgi:vitamin B12 transporter